MRCDDPDAAEPDVERAGDVCEGLHAEQTDGAQERRLAAAGFRLAQEDGTCVCIDRRRGVVEGARQPCSSPDWEFDEHMMGELKNGRLWMLRAQEGPAAREFLHRWRQDLEHSKAGRDGAECKRALLPSSAQIRPHSAREERIARQALPKRTHIGAWLSDDEGHGVTQSGLQTVLIMAVERYGQQIKVNGTADFKEQIAQAAAAAKLPITFDDTALERRRQEILHSITTKEHDNEQRRASVNRGRINRCGNGSFRFTTKGVGLIVPTLLSWPESAVITDLKGELLAVASGWRQKYAKNKVLRFEPAISNGGVCWNPFDELRISGKWCQRANRRCRPALLCEITGAGDVP